jgi:flotillin
MLVDEWSTAGGQARDIYLLQQLDVIVAAAVGRVQSMTVEELEIVDGGDAESLTAVASGFSLSVTRVLEETGRAMGIDIRALIAGTPSLPEGDSPHTLRGGSR